MITQFGKTSVQYLQEEAAALLQALAAKHGVEIRSAGGTFDVDKASLRFEFRLLSEDAERAAFAQNCEFFGCQPSDYGRVATVNGKEVKLIGFELKRRSFPIRVRATVGGKVSLFNARVLRSHFHTGFVESVAAPITASPVVRLT